jgi:redox-sensitive bicupin YhaK (pirin superfamily)
MTTPLHFKKPSPASTQGIETIPYVLAGRVDHGDSLDNASSFGAGDH